MRVKTSTDHGGEFVVSGAQVGQQAAYVRRVAFQRGVMLMEAGCVMMVMRGH